jgi:hypothetical protein
MTALALLLAGSLAGCSSTLTTAGDASRSPSARTGGPGSGAATGGGAIPVGPGPQPDYTVQRQPAAGSCHYRYEHTEPLPDASCTPGATNPKVTQATLKTTICRSGGYTSGIRPPVNITGREKIANAKSYGYAKSLRNAEYDHLISLQLGGDPNDARNLWVEPPSPGHKPGSGPNNEKDKVETRLHTAVCKGRATLEAVQKAIATDWYTAETVLGLKPR